MGKNVKNILDTSGLGYAWEIQSSINYKSFPVIVKQSICMFYRVKPSVKYFIDLSNTDKAVMLLNVA